MTALVPHRHYPLDAPLDTELALRYCEGIATGRTLAAIEQDPDMPPKGVFLAWAMRHPEVQAAFKAALSTSAYVIADEALELLRSALTAPGTQAERGARQDFVAQVRWEAARRNPQVFSEKAAVNVTVPVQINTTLDMGGGGGGTKEHPNIYDLKATTVHEIDDPDPTLVPTTANAKKPEPKRGKRWATVGKKRILVPRVAETVEEVHHRVEMAKKRAEQAKAARAKYYRDRRAKQKEAGDGGDTHPQD